MLCRGPGQLALGKEPSLPRHRDFAESAPLPAFGGQGLCRERAFALSAKSLFVDRLFSDLGKEPFAEHLTWRSTKEGLYRVSTRRPSAKNAALGKVGFSCSDWCLTFHHSGFSTFISLVILDQHCVWLCLVLVEVKGMKCGEFLFVLFQKQLQHL